MSKPTQRIPHLVFTSGVGFQYYFALPKSMSQIPGLPKAVRWSLGSHHETAKQLAEKLNAGFGKLVAKAPGLSAQQVLQQLEQLRTLNYRALHSLDLPLGSLPPRSSWHFSPSRRAITAWRFWKACGRWPSKTASSISPPWTRHSANPAPARCFSTSKLGGFRSERKT
ncbi:hypothetical protein [Pseudomonas taiwanensis]|uniref:hypothetical protein n=1 Tax=Pseudomonas taiwanensis TaxID=470150 RepID=UPI0015BF1014|nr:hypothetical protein [Pseudomonas taiwanensis]